MAVVSAMFVEGLQAVIGHGHRFRWYELVAKLLLVLAGFVFALNARFERTIRLGPLTIPLSASPARRTR